MDVNGGVLRVINVAAAGELTKSRKNRTLPMHSVVNTELSTLEVGVPIVVKSGEKHPKHPHFLTDDAGQPIRPDRVSHEFTRIVKRAGAAHCTLHDLRRSFPTSA